MTGGAALGGGGGVMVGAASGAGAAALLQFSDAAGEAATAVPPRQSVTRGWTASSTEVRNVLKRPAMVSSRPSLRPRQFQARQAELRAATPHPPPSAASTSGRSAWVILLLALTSLSGTPRSIASRTVR